MYTTVQLAEHSIIPSLLPEAPVVLDVGCRDFEFCKAVLQLRPKAQIIALDPDPEIIDPEINGVTFLNLALVHNDKKFSKYVSYGSNGTSKGYGNHLTEYDVEHQDTKIITVPCVRMLTLMTASGISHWDLVKMDCEGSEFAILATWPSRCATQLSIEFHDSSLLSPDLFPSLEEYEAVQHKAFNTTAGYGHWDSVFVLRGL